MLTGTGGRAGRAPRAGSVACGQYQKAAPAAAMMARAPAITSVVRRERAAPLMKVSTCLPRSAWALLFFSRHATAMIVTVPGRLRKLACGCVSGASSGGHAGYMWGRSGVWDEGELFEKDAPTNGLVGGVLGGVNWQTRAWVLGLEGDFGWTNAHGTGVIAGSAPSNQYDSNWTSHIR